MVANDRGFLDLLMGSSHILGEMERFALLQRRRLADSFLYFLSPELVPLEVSKSSTQEPGSKAYMFLSVSSCRGPSPFLGPARWQGSLQLCSLTDHIPGIIFEEAIRIRKVETNKLKRRKKGKEKEARYIIQKETKRKALVKTITFVNVLGLLTSTSIFQK